jgi:hypothetical protein
MLETQTKSNTTQYRKLFLKLQQIWQYQTSWDGKQQIVLPLEYYTSNEWLYLHMEPGTCLTSYKCMYHGKDSTASTQEFLITWQEQHPNDSTVSNPNKPRL